jgi:hypothetical protein
MSIVLAFQALADGNFAVLVLFLGTSDPNQLRIDDGNCQDQERAQAIPKWFGHVRAAGLRIYLYASLTWTVTNYLIRQILRST